MSNTINIIFGTYGRDQVFILDNDNWRDYKIYDVDYAGEVLKIALNHIDNGGIITGISLTELYKMVEEKTKERIVKAIQLTMEEI